VFHTYVTASSGRTVDFHRARTLMDRGLLRDAVKAMNAAMSTGVSDWDKSCAERNGMTFNPFGPQWIWDHYCERHREKYDTDFQPDADPSWDA